MGTTENLKDTDLFETAVSIIGSQLKISILTGFRSRYEGADSLIEWESANLTIAQKLARKNWGDRKDDVTLIRKALHRAAEKVADAFEEFPIPVVEQIQQFVASYDPKDILVGYEPIEGHGGT